MPTPCFSSKLYSSFEKPDSGPLTNKTGNFTSSRGEEEGLVSPKKIKASF
jgi:hypothetical protein